MKTETFDLNFRKALPCVISQFSALTLTLSFIFALTLLVGCKGPAVNPGATLEAGFLNPPDSAKPRVWWHWMNGNITKEGIRADLEWMHRVGIGGFQNFDAALMTPQIVQKRLTYMTDDWKDAFSFATGLADSLGLEMAIAGSPGWSESGGPWVKPEDGMKKIVWSELAVRGGTTFTGTIPKPPVVTGPFQNIAGNESLSIGDQTAVKPPEYFQDIAVVACKLPPTDVPLQDLKPRVSSSGGSFNLNQLTDGDLMTTSFLPADTAKGYAWICFEFDHPQTIKSVTIVGGGDKGPFGLTGNLTETRSLEISDDGKSFRHVCFIPAGNVVEQTISVPVSTSKFFRISFKNPPAMAGLASLLGNNAPKPPSGTEIAEIVLSPSTRINRFEEKCAFAPASDLYDQATPATDDPIAATDVIDLTGKMDTDGSLTWTAPPGNWIIIRFGYSLLGITNHPATAEATGFEVDKLDPAAVKRYFENYLDQYRNATKGLMGSKGGLKFMVTDSWEAGAQNWTGNMMQEFEKRRGYSMINWLPVFAGHVVKSSEESDRFLWDFRKTLSEMVAEYHYDQLTNILETYGMKRYSESHESGRALIADGMEVKRKAAVPMSAMWVPNVLSGNNTSGYEADIRESASVAHIYGQNLAAAESFTAFGLGGNAWSYYPGNLKPTADLELASGLNRFVIHTSVHQPNDKIPGLSLGPFGQWFTRHETWAEQAGPWLKYLSRSSYMLQQGKFVADIIYFYGEDNNITALFGPKLPDIPQGYAYDFVNADALLNLLDVKRGLIVTPGGMSYKLLVLDHNCQQMSLPVLQKIYDLVKAGAIVTGVKPVQSPSLSDDPQVFRKIVNELWAKENDDNVVGQGKVITGKTLKEVLDMLKVVPDFIYTKSIENTSLLYVHRKMNDIDIYWVSNRNNPAQNLNCTFRINGKSPEIWHPETGLIEKVTYNIVDGKTSVPLRLEPNDAVFVVFRENAREKSLTIPQKIATKLTLINGPWNVKFQTGRGAKAEATFDTLTPWNLNEDDGIKYFSGTGSYSRTFDAPANWFKEGSLISVDLGEVKNMAEVVVNGKSQGVLWKTPYKVDITGALKQGENQLEIKVTNLWVNRLIGDLQPGVHNKITFTTMPFYKPESPLQPSGLMGPVQIIGYSDK